MHSERYNIAVHPGAATRTRSRRGGFSLVEILVAITILTVGIFAFLEIFPGGFYSLQVAANTSAADRLAQAELNQLTSDNGSDIQQIAAVEQVYASGVDVGDVELDPNYNPDKALTKLSGVPLLTSSAFNDQEMIGGASTTVPYEYVAGERVTIPPSPANTTGAVTNPPSDVLLNFGPFIVPQVATSGTAGVISYPSLSTFNSLDPGAHAEFFVHGLPWLSKQGNSQDVTPVGTGSAPAPVDDPNIELTQDSPEYLIDDNNEELALHIPTNGYPEKFIFQVNILTPGTPATVVTKTFIFEADWIAPASATPPANDFPAGINGNVFWNTTYNRSQWVSLAGIKDVTGTYTLPAQGTATFVPGTDKLIRDFNYIAPTANFDNDPYEFQLPTLASTPPLTTTELGTDSVGDPVFLGQIQFNPLASKIVDNRGLPLQASVDYIVQDWHTIHEDRTVGSQSDTSQITQANSVVRLTLNDILRVDAKDQVGNVFQGIGFSTSAVIVYDEDTGLILPANAYTVDYVDGAITLLGNPPAPTPGALSGEHIRVYYHPAFDWGVSALKAAATYDVTANTSTAAGTDTPTLTGAAVWDDVPANATFGNLYFPVVDNGRMVQIGGTVTYTAPGGTQSQTAQLNYLDTLTPAIGQTDTSSPFVSLLTAAGAPAGSTLTGASPTVTAASLTVRVVWRERDIWRHRDVTTVDLPGGN